jgi:hypothetical protein
MIARSSVLLIALLASWSACGPREAGVPERAPYVPLENAEERFGKLLTASNHPTPDQHGTGERVGFFRAADGTIWGLPIALDEGGEVTACVAPALSTSPVTDHLPATAVDVIGATNAPTGWRGGTGGLELLIRDARGSLRWLPVKSGRIMQGAKCWAKEPPGPRQELHYYRLATQ